MIWRIQLLRPCSSLQHCAQHCCIKCAEKKKSSKICFSPEVSYIESSGWSLQTKDKLFFWCWAFWVKVVNKCWGHLFWLTVNVFDYAYTKCSYFIQKKCESPRQYFTMGIRQCELLSQVCCHWEVRFIQNSHLCCTDKELTLWRSGTLRCSFL